MNASLRNVCFRLSPAIDSSDRNDSGELSYRNDDWVADVYLDSVIVGSRLDLPRHWSTPFKLRRIDRIPLQT